MNSNITTIQEVAPLSEKDFLYTADQRKTEFMYPIPVLVQRAIQKIAKNSQSLKLRDFGYFLNKPIVNKHFN